MSIRTPHRVVLCLVAALACTAPTSVVAATFTLYVPTSASIHGNAEAFFHTDLWVFNRSYDTSLSVTANYRCFAGPCTSPSSTFSLAPRESRLYTDVVVALFGKAETAGAIEFVYTSATEDLAATSRTYTPNLPLPTNGTAIPALTLRDARSRALFLGLGSNGGNLASGFRTNAGAYNPTSGFSFVTFTLLSQDGTPLGSTGLPLYSRTAGQINDIFAAAGAGAAVTTNAVLVVRSEQPVFPFVTVVDNQSGDSVYATPSDDRPASPSTSLVVNGGFDTGIGSWTNPSPNFIAMSWSPTDATGNPASGSIRVTNTDTHAGFGGSGPTQCVALTPGSLANISMRIRIPSGQSGTANVAPWLAFYSGNDCTGTGGGSIVLTVPSQFDTWEMQTSTETVPPNMHSGMLILWIGKTSDAGTFMAYFDDVSVVSSAR